MANKKSVTKTRVPFHITVGVSDIKTGDVAATVEHHVRIAKVALLYGDEVTLCSPVATLVLPLASLDKLPQRQQLELLELLAPHLMPPSESRDLVVNYCRLQREAFGKRVPANLARINAGFFQNHLTPMMRGLGDLASKLADEYRVGELSKLIQTGKVKISHLGAQKNTAQWLASVIVDGLSLKASLSEVGFVYSSSQRPIDANEKQITQDFLTQLEAVVQDPAKYPMFDDFTGNLVRLGIEAGQINTSSATTQRAKAVGLAAELISKLPTFESASANEVIDIRNALDVPLVNFRSAMVKYAKEVESASWDKDFPFEVDQLFIERVAPAVAAIEDEVKTNKYLYELGYSLLSASVPVTASSALGIGLSTVAGLSDVVNASMGASAGLAVLSIHAHKKWLDKQREIEKNQMFFYYKARKMLSEK
jgi:hypothetical protein